MTIPQITADDLRRAILQSALERLAESEGEAEPDEDAQADADLILARLEEPAFSELLAQMNEEGDATTPANPPH